MSQYLSFYLIKKDNTEKISLGYFCTTPARQIAYIGAFPYIEDKTILDKTTFFDFLKIIKEERDKYDKYLSEIIKKKQEIEQNIFKCASKEIAQMFINQVEEFEFSITDYKEILEDWDYRINKLEFINDVWEDNKDNWDLYYNNC